MLRFLSSIFLIVLSITICLASIKLGIGELRDPAPGFMPFFTSCLLFFLCTVVLIKDVIGRMNQGENTKHLRVQIKFLKPMSLVVVLFVYTLLLDFLGYVITMSLTMFLMLSIFDPDTRKWWKYCIIGALASTLSFLIFYKGLHLELPMGILRIRF